MEHKIKVDEKDHALDGQNKMNSFRKEKKHCDFIIKVESEEISVHRAVICSHSDYFDAMFSHDTKEKRTGVAEIKGVERECTVKCVDFMYTGETSITEDNCGNLLHVATLLQLLTLCNAIAAFLEEKLDCKSFFATKQLSDLYSCQKLVDACNEFALKHFQEIAQLDGFNELDRNYIELITGSKDNNADEGAKCKSLIEWVKHDASNRESFLITLMRNLDLTKIAASYRSFLLDHEPLVYSSAECLKDIAKSFAKTFNVESKDFAANTAEHTLTDSTPKTGIAIFDCISKTLQTFDPVTKTWTQGQAFNDEMSNNKFSTAVLDEHLYVFLFNKNVYRICHSDVRATWERMAGKNLGYGPVVVLDGMFYTLEYFDYKNRLERFIPAQNKWQTMLNKKLSVYGAALAVADGKIFAISGYDNTSRFRTEVEMFDPTTSSWSSDSHLKRARYFSSAVTVENRIYVSGGYGTGHKFTSCVDYRCPRSKTWIAISSMRIPRSSFCSWSINGRIYAIGGDQSNPQTIEEFDLEKIEWNVVLQMNGKDIRRLASVAM